MKCLEYHRKMQECFSIKLITIRESRKLIQAKIDFPSTSSKRGCPLCVAYNIWISKTSLSCWHCPYTKLAESSNPKRLPCGIIRKSYASEGRYCASRVVMYTKMLTILNQIHANNKALKTMKNTCPNCGAYLKANNFSAGL